ncbi:hypothetical protein ES703_112100 [subsurface metagenome]
MDRMKRRSFLKQTGVMAAYGYYTIKTIGNRSQ